MTKINHALKLLTTIASVFFMGYLLESYASASTLLNDFFEISTNLLPLVMSISIFVMTWHAYNKNKNNTSLFLGAALLVIGLFDLYHVLSYPFMPDFITPNSHQKTMVFWGGARLISALFFLAGVFIYKDSFPRLINKPVLIVSINVFNIVFLNMILAYSDHLPVINYPDGSFSTTGILLLLLTSVITLTVAYLYSRSLKETGQESTVYLIYGFIIIAFSNLAYFDYDSSGNLLRAAGYYFIYLALFKLSIEQPYEKRVEVDEKRIHSAKERYRNLFDNANDAIITTDLENRITSWNLSAEKIFGWKAREVIGKNLAQTIVSPDIHAETERLINDIMSGKTVAGIETVRLRSGGTGIDVSLTISPILDTDQNIIGFSSIIRDITERKQTEKLLRQSEEKYRTLIENIQDGVFIIQDAKIEFVNEAFARMVGYTVEEVIGMDFQEFVAPEDLKTVTDRYYRRQSGESVPKEYEFCILHRDGTRIIVNMNVGLINYRGRLASMRTVKNITEHKLADEQIKASLREKEVLLREIHHRVKNNMQVISSLLKLQAGYIKDKKYLDMFKDSQGRIMSMSLVYEKLYKSEGMAKINFNGYVKDLVTDLFQSFGVKQDTITLNINAEDVSFGVDTAIPCGLVVNELVTNSLKHAFPDSRKGEIRISLCKADDDEFELVVGDNGVGIPEEIDFRKTESLGPHLVKILAENQLQGEINLDRRKGTEFQIKFKGGK